MTFTLSFFFCILYAFPLPWKWSNFQSLKPIILWSFIQRHINRASKHWLCRLWITFALAVNNSTVSDNSFTMGSVTSSMACILSIYIGGTLPVLYNLKQGSSLLTWRWPKFILVTSLLRARYRRLRDDYLDPHDVCSRNLTWIPPFLICDSKVQNGQLMSS